MQYFSTSKPCLSRRSKERVKLPYNTGLITIGIKISIIKHIPLDAGDYLKRGDHRHRFRLYNVKLGLCSSCAGTLSSGIYNIQLYCRTPKAMLRSSASPRPQFFDLEEKVTNKGLSHIPYIIMRNTAIIRLSTAYENEKELFG